MTNPTNPDEHNGHTNFETWAFYTHVTQTERLLNQALTIARPLVEQDFHPAVVGDHVVRWFKEWAMTMLETHTRYEGADCYDDARMMAQDVGSWWRIDDISIGRHLTQYVKEAAA
jgi:hypothetical protein